MHVIRTPWQRGLQQMRAPWPDGAAGLHNPSAGVQYCESHASRLLRLQGEVS